MEFQLSLLSIFYRISNVVHGGGGGGGGGWGAGVDISGIALYVKFLLFTLFISLF